MRARWLAGSFVALIGCSSFRTPPTESPPLPTTPVASVASTPGVIPASATQPPALPLTPTPKDEDPLSLVAECLGRGDNAGACTQLERYVLRHPDQLMFRAQLAELLLKADNPARARFHFTQFASEAHDAVGPPKAHLVHCHTRLMEIAQRADDRFGELFHRGMGLFVLVQQLETSPGDADEGFREEILCKAIKALTEAAEHGPHDPRVHLYLSDAYAKLGNRRASEAERRLARNLALPGVLSPSEQRRLAVSTIRE